MKKSGVKSDMPRILVHIGTHKTGTTSIQDALEQGRDQLLAHGVLYPATNRDPWPDLTKHTSVFSAAKNGGLSVVQQERATLLDEFSRSGAHTMIISEEGLSEPETCFRDFFTPLTKDYEVATICYFRRQDLFAESLYNQFVRERARREARSITQFWRAPAIRQRLRYHSILKQWEDVGIEVHALEFDSTVKGEGLLKSFLRVAGCPDAGLREQPSNKSPDMQLILALAKMNGMNFDIDLPRLMASARKLAEKFNHPKQRYLLGANERKKILEEMAGENVLLNRNYGVQFSDLLPNDEATFPTLDPDQNYLIALLALTSVAQK